MNKEKRPNYFPHTFKPNDLIATIEKNGLRIDTSKLAIYEGQSGSLFSPVLVLRQRVGKEDDWVKPRIMTIDIPTRSGVGIPKPEKGEPKSDNTKYRASLHKVNLRFNPDVSYEERDGTVQEWGKAVVLFSEKYKELLNDLRLGKGTTSGKPEFLNGKSSKVYVPYKTHYSDDSIGEIIAHTSPFIEALVEFNENAPYEPKKVIGDLRKSTAKITVPVTIIDEDKSRISINALNAHKFFKANTIIAGELDLTNTSRTSMGTGVTAKLYNIRIVPGRKQERDIFDEDQYEAIKNKYADEEEEEESSFVNDEVETKEGANSTDEGNKLASIMEVTSIKKD
jgi:hypothetical protein